MNFIQRLFAKSKIGTSKIHKKTRTPEDAGDRLEKMADLIERYGLKFEDTEWDQFFESTDKASAMPDFAKYMNTCIIKAGYRKASDFYGRLEYDRRGWYKLLHNPVTSKEPLLKIAVALRMNGEDASDLLNAAGKTFQKNSGRDMAVYQVLQSGKLAGMTPEKALGLVDEILYVLGYPLLGTEK